MSLYIEQVQGRLYIRETQVVNVLRWRSFWQGILQTLTEFESAANLNATM